MSDVSGVDPNEFEVEMRKVDRGDCVVRLETATEGGI